MAWTAPLTYTSNDGFGFADINKTNENLNAIYNTGIKSNTDATWVMGRMSMYGTSDIAHISHYDKADANNFALKMYPSGFNRLNFSTGQSLEIQENGTNTIVSVSGADVNIFKPVTIKSTLFKIERSATTQNITIDTETGSASYRMNNTTSATYGRHKFYSANNIDEIEVLEFNADAISLLKPVTIENVAQTGVWSQDSTYARWGHKDFNTASNYGILQQDNSDVYIGAPELYVSAHLNPTTTPTSGTWTINQVIPRGQYNVQLVQGGTFSSILVSGAQILTNNGAIGSTNGASIYSDGINVTTFMGAGASINYWKY